MKELQELNAVRKDVEKEQAFELLDDIKGDIEEHGMRDIIILRVHDGQVDVSWINLNELEVLGALSRANHVFNLSNCGKAEVV